MIDWYDIIEEPVRELVRMLRDNGINTTCSCGHTMEIQAELSPDGEIERLHRLLFDFLSEHQMNVEYDLVFRLEVRSGRLWRTWVDIALKPD